MPKPRKSLISLDDTPYYHCVSRCVRRAFLCGEDHLTGNSYEHRREWVEQRLQQLVKVFAIDLCAYAVMHNHYHVVLRVDRDRANAWHEDEVLKRWQTLFQLPVFVERYRQNKKGAGTEFRAQEEIAKYRERLMSVSWFMRCINEPIARQANAEDRCTGRFWEGRFKSQALLDEAALAAAMAYVDLNPVRAGIADTPEASEFTSIKARTEALQSADSQEQLNPPSLLPFAGNPRQEMPDGLPFVLSHYLDLVDWTGRQLRDDKHGCIDGSLPPILERLAIDPAHWFKMCHTFEIDFAGLVGRHEVLCQVCQKQGRRLTGLRAIASVPGLSFLYSQLQSTTPTADSTLSARLLIPPCIPISPKTGLRLDWPTPATEIGQ